MRSRAAIVLLALATASCSGAASDATFNLEVLPEFVNGVYPEAKLVLLATVNSADDSPIALTATAAGADVVVEPTDIRPGDVAEVTVVPEPTTQELPLTVTITARRGGTEQRLEKQTPVVPELDQLGSEARELLDVFVDWMAEKRPDLGITATTEVEGNAVAPRLLVVTHYMFMSPDWEIGLSWHIMIPPDDWAELYLRRRGEAAPIEAFRLSSRSAALQEGIVEIGEVPPPAEVVR